MDLQRLMMEALAKPVVTPRMVTLFAEQPALHNVTLVYLDPEKKELKHGPLAPGDPDRKVLAFLNNPTILPRGAGYLVRVSTFTYCAIPDGQTSVASTRMRWA